MEDNPEAQQGQLGDAARFMAALVGKRAKFHWGSRHGWQHGTIDAYDSSHQLHTVKYDDNEIDNEADLLGAARKWQLE